MQIFRQILSIQDKIMTSNLSDVFNVSPRTQIMQDIVAKLPNISIAKSDHYIQLGDGSPPLKRKRSSSASSPDIRRKVLERAVESKLSSSVLLQEHMKMKSKTTILARQQDEDIVSISSNLDCSLDEIQNEYVKEEISVIDLIDQSIELVEESVSKPTSPSLNKPNSDGTFPKSPKKELSTYKLTQSPTIESSKNLLKDSSKQIQWTEVRRSKRKVRIYFIEANSEDEGFKAVYKAKEKFLIPSCVNGRKPFTAVPGIDYGLGVDLEEVGEALADKNDDKELKIIQNENYLLDSFCCDTGYLSDEELNETPSVNKIVSRVKQQRRANNIKDKRKFEKLNEPQVLGPFWWTGKEGCKKELKRWQPMVFSECPISSGFTIETLETHNVEEESSRDPFFISKPKESDSTPLDGSELLVTRAKPTPASTESSVTVECNEKYSIKYLVKFIVEKTMRAVLRPEETSPIESSTPMSMRANVIVTQVKLQR